MLRPYRDAEINSQSPEVAAVAIPGRPIVVLAIGIAGVASPARPRREADLEGGGERRTEEQRRKDQGVRDGVGREERQDEHTRDQDSSDVEPRRNRKVFHRVRLGGAE